MIQKKKKELIPPWEGSSYTAKTVSRYMLQRVTNFLSSFIQTVQQGTYLEGRVTVYGYERGTADTLTSMILTKTEVVRNNQQEEE